MIESVLINVMDPATLEHLLLREIRKSPGISRRDLAQRLEVARSTAGRRVDSMIGTGAVEEIGIEYTAEAGRPKRQLKLRGDYGSFIGFDFDARNIYGVLVDFAQSTLEKIKVSLTERPSKDEVIEHLKKAIGHFSNTRQGNLHGIGLGIPGPVRQKERIAVDYPYISGWKNVKLCDELGFGPEILRIEHNTKAMALGEYWLEKTASVENLICINVRTGISAAIISDGHLIRGAHEIGGEIGGWSSKGPENTNPKPEWLENRATVRAIFPRSIATPEAWADFVESCQREDRKALQQLSIMASYHGDTVARLTQLVDPEIVVFAGAFNEIGNPYLEQIRQATARALLGHFVAPPPIRFVSQGEFSGAQGAAALSAMHFKPY